MILNNDCNWLQIGNNYHQLRGMRNDSIELMMYHVIVKIVLKDFIFI